jgi:hypothetical protein
MTAYSQLFGYPSLALAAAVESIVAIKLFPDSYGTTSHRVVGISIFGANLLFWVLFWGLIYPRLLSPLRKLKGPRVSLCKGWQVAPFRSVVG